jgi:neutral ceramidase
MNIDSALLAGAAEVDITPPIGSAMVGALVPRFSTGIDDPLMAKALVLESERVRMAVVALDLATLPRRWGDACVRAAAEKTGIPPEHIVWCATHTHTGPIAEPEVYLDGVQPSDLAWLEKLPAQFATAVAQALALRQPARLSRCRTFCEGVASCRRIRFKNGLDLNNWNLNAAEPGVQSLGFTSHPDPEVNALCFDTESGQPLAILWTFACHTNANFGPKFSADYPAITAAHLRRHFGNTVVPIYLPGACGDVNPLLKWNEMGTRLADVLIPVLDARQPVSGPIPLQVIKQEIVVPARAFRTDEAHRRQVSGWSADGITWFERSEAFLKKRNETKLHTLLQSWRIGEVGFVSLPGEIFVERGLDLKRLSPFPWTYPVALGGDYVGYLVTHKDEQAGGYESLNCWVSRTGPEGVDQMVDGGLKLLQQLWSAPHDAG